MSQTLSIVIPAYNEAPTIHFILDKVKAVELAGGLNKEVIIVNDCSRDDTKGAIQRYMADNPGLPIQYYEHEVNQGKGAALHTGIREAKGDFIIIQDADLEYDPAEYRKLIQPIVEGQADVVFGSRFAGDNQRVLYFWHYMGNRFLTLMSNFFTNLNLTDMETCYKVFRADVVKDIPLRARGFEFEPEITAKLLKRGHRIYEVPISYNGREFDEGKKIRPWRDGSLALWSLIKYRFVD